MRPGKLRQVVTLQRPVPPGDGVTDEPLDYEDVATRPAEVRPVSVKEIYAAGGYLGQSDLVVTLRHEPVFDDLNNTWKIWWDNRKLNVHGKLNINMRDRWLSISTTQDQSDIRLRDREFEQPLHEAVHVVMPELTDGTDNPN